MKRTMLGTLAALSFTLLAASAATGQTIHQRGEETVTPANTYGVGVPMSGEATVKVGRNGRGIHLKGTAWVEPNHAYTVWWIVFGTDENGDGEVPVVLNATGGVSTHTGEFHFSAGLPVGTYVEGATIPELVFLGGEVDEPLTAPLLLHVLDHGPPIPGLVPRQISDIFTGPPGYCDPAAGCPLAVEISVPAP